MKHNTKGHQGNTRRAMKKHAAHDITDGEKFKTSRKHRFNAMAGPDTSNDRAVQEQYGVHL